MNTIWSDCVQGIDTLYLTRALRFSDEYRQQYVDAFGLGDGRGLRVLEVGCGPGALAQALARWYPGAEITGIDRDSAFIEYAARRAPGLRFVEGDATALPFVEGEFDVTISNTVQEHVEPARFFGEQRRVLRRGGVCLVLSARRGVSVEAECVAGDSALEREVWARVEARRQALERECGIARYAMSERELPLALQAHGFEQVSTAYLAINLTPDNPATPPARARAIIEAQRRTRLDALHSLERMAPGAVSASELRELEAQLERRYAARRALYDAGERQWDASVSLTMVVRGVRP